MVSFSPMKMTQSPFVPRPQTRNPRFHLKLRPAVATAIAVSWGLAVSLVLLTIVTP